MMLMKFVMYDGHESGLKLVWCGVPKGFILGTLLFLLYINDLTNVSIFYADTFYILLMIAIFLHWNWPQRYESINQWGNGWTLYAWLDAN